MKKITLLFAAVLLLFFHPVSGIAQESGIPTFGKGATPDIDTINLATLYPVLNIPVRSKIGIIPTKFEYVISEGCSGGQGAYCFTVGEMIDANFSGYTALSTVQSPGAQCISDPPSNSVVYSGWVIVSADRLSSHPLDPSLSLDGCGGPLSFTGTTIDGSGLTLTETATLDNNDNSVLTTTSLLTAGGDILTGAVSGFPLSSVITDPFGNEVKGTADSSGIAVISGPTVSGNNASYTWVDTNGDTDSFGLIAGSALTPYGPCVADQHPAFYPLKSISYPDGTSIGITMQAGPGGVGTTTGLISSFMLRTGGTVSYTYTMSACSGGQHITALIRTTQDGATQYSLSGVTSAGSTTTVLDPGLNKTVYTFTTGTSSEPTANAQVLTQVQKYQNTGTVASPVYTLLETTNICYNGTTSGCSTATYTYPITQRDTYVTIAGMSTQSDVRETFDSYGNVTSLTRFDFGPFGPTSFATKTATTYGSWNGSMCVSVGSNIYNLPCTIVTTDNASHTLTQSRYTYNSKGSMTASSKWTGSLWLTTTFTPNSNGTIASSTDPNGAVTTYGYAETNSGGCSGTTSLAGLLETSVTALGLKTSRTWNCEGGMVMSTTGPSGGGTTEQYDEMFRITSYTDALEFPTAFTYAATSSQKTSSYGESVNNTITSVDSLGRTNRTQKQQSSTSADYDTQSTTYTFSGPNRQVATSTPCTEPLGTPCTNYFTTSTTDPLGRLIQTTDPGGGTTTYAYTQNDTGVTVGPAPSGGATKKVHTEVDGLGRVKTKCSILSSGGTACGQTMTGSGILDTYTYTFGSGTSTVSITRGAQTRTTVYDALGRVLSTTTPEGGTTTYIYDSWPAGGCGWTSQPGDLMATVNNDGSSVCYVHDALHRLIRTGTSETPNTCKSFIYDSVSNALQPQPPNSSFTNLAGRLVEAETDNCTVWPPTPASMITDEWFSYDANGTMTDMWEWTPHSGQYYETYVDPFPLNTAYEYVVLYDPVFVLEFFMDGEGRPYSVTDNSSTYIISSVTYNASSSPLVITDANGNADTYAYDPATNRTNSYTFVVGGYHETGSLTWNANGSLAKLAVADGFNQGGTQTCTFSYDDVERLVTDNCGSSLWSQTYSYDQYDNLTKTGNPGVSWIPGYNAANNRYSSIGATYDGAGRLTYDGNAAYTWDGYGKMAAVNLGNNAATCGTNGTCVTYDALGRAVETNVAGTYSEILYSAAGELGIMSGSTVNKLYLPLPGGVQGIENSAGSMMLGHKDWLGTTRLVSTFVSGGSDAVVYDRAVAPYGETYANFGTPTNIDFTGDRQDIFSGNNMFDTPNRELNATQGRWLSPDPAGQGWNLYAYPTNPNSMTDPTGLFCFYGSIGDNAFNDHETTDFNFDETGPEGELDCAQEGGQWYQDYTEVTVNGAKPGDIATNPSFENGQQIFPQIVLTPNTGKTPRCVGTRVAQGIQGVVNIGLGELKTAGAIGVGLLGAAGAPETGGASLSVDLAAGYLVVSSQGQVLSGGAQLYSAISGNFQAGEQIEQVGNIMSGPISGITTLVATNNPEAAALAANTESAITLGAGAFNSETVTDQIANGIDAALTFLGLGQGNCQVP